MRTRHITFRSIRARLAVAALVAGVLVLAAGPRAAADEGYDLMRQITTQWVKPLIMIVFDRSGSMNWTVDEPDSTWNFKYDGSTQGYVYSQADWTYHNYGRGQGFWMRVKEMHALATPPTDFVYDNYRSANGWVDHDYSNNIYSPQSELPAGLQLGDMIRVVDYPIDSVNGIYIVAQESRASSHNPGWWYTKFYKMNPDGTFDDTVYRFPLVNGNDVKPFSFERVTLVSDPNQFTLVGSWHWGSFRKNKCYVTITDARDHFDVGDVVKLGKFGGRNGYYLIRHFNGDRVYLSRIDASGAFPNQDYCFPGNNDDSIRMRRVELPWEPRTVWYFVPPSRMAVAKNVWGDSVELYQPAVTPDGYDANDKPYYIFDGEGPVNGAWKEWEDSSDNGSGGSWHNWSASQGHAPVGDPAYTEVVQPSDMVGRFSKVADMGLVVFHGGCSTFNPTVNINPDDNDQAAVLTAIHNRFKVVGQGGLSPGGGTPTRAGLQGAITGLTSAFQADTKKECGRTYGVILMTDGQSNACNYGGSYCWRDPWTHRCDGSNPGFNCPAHWDQYPAGVANQLWNLTVGGTALHARTWAIGVSNGIGPCELNYTAYKGRTDASSPNGDAGFDISADPYLSEGNDDVFDDEVLDPTDGDAGHGPYAYFAGSVDELRRALLDILASLGVGDYTTSAPAVAGSASVATNVAVVPSSEYPSWKGHLRAFANQVSNGVSQWVELLDAGEVLSSANNNNGFTRHIYTWDPTDGNALVPISSDATTVAKLDAICSGCGIDADVVNFIRGSGRDWRLGALINSTPAVIGPPNHWRQGTAEAHSAFEDEYGMRHTLVWVGSSDGMIHAFDTEDGAEIIALVPPDLLDNQVELQHTWSVNPTKFPMGQYRHPAEHLYGVANSLRFADVYDPDINTYRTVLLVPEGPGGTGLHALDVTHVYPGRTIGVSPNEETFDPDPNYDSAEPVKVLWSLTQDGEAGTTALSSLGQSWSLPAVAMVPVSNQNATPQSVVVLGQGYVENTGNTEQPKTLVLNPLTGDVIDTHTLANENSGWLVGNQAFADAVLWQTDAGQYKEDNLADEAIQVDLNGHMYTMTGSGLGSQDLILETGADQPLYYSPGVGAYPTVGPAYNLFAFSSGTFYEKNETVTGSSTSFVPKIWVAVRSLNDGSIEKGSVAITDIPLPEGQNGTLSDRAQVIAPPLLLVPVQGSSHNPFALYLVYDPEGGLCVGKSYIVWVNFDPENLNGLINNPGDWVETYEAGEGASGGFALAGDKVVISQSAVGQGAEAGIVEVPGLTIPPGNPGLNISWWYELR